MVKLLKSCYKELISIFITLLIANAIDLQAGTIYGRDRRVCASKFSKLEGNRNFDKTGQAKLSANGRADSINVLDSMKWSHWNIDHWSDSMKYKYYYNVNGDIEYSILKYWDTDHWDYNFNVAFSYDDSGRLIERIEQDFNSDYYEFIFRRLIFTYNTEGCLADSTEQYWNFQLELWENLTKHSYIYDVYGNQTEYLYQIYQWFGDGLTWIDDSKAFYTYDGNNNKTSYISQWWDEGMTQWLNIEKDSLIYDGSNNLIDSSTFVWEIDHWQSAMKITYAYDAHGNMIEELHQYEGGGQWINTWKFTYGYDTHGNVTDYLEQYWDPGWENSWRESFTYDGNDNLTENIGEYWNWADNFWVTYDRNTYTYDTGDNLIHYLGELWDTDHWNNDILKAYFFSYKSTVPADSGSDIEVSLDSGIVVIFDSISTSGTISVTIADDGPPPEEFEFLPSDSGKYIFITTDAEYIGGIEICFPYSDSLLTAEEESTIRIFHYTDAQWVDITTSHDTANNIICGTTVNLSPFVLGMPTQPLDVFENDDLNLPRKFSLDQNYPNPFNPSTIINYSLPRRSNVKIEIYNILGQTVRQLTDENRTAGNHSVTWDGLDNNGQSVSTGVYFYRITADNFTETKKMLLLK